MPTAVLRDRDLVPARKKKGTARFLPALGAGIATAVLLALIIRSFFLVPVRVKTADMEPRLKKGSSYFVRMGALQGTVARGDLVWLRYPGAPGLKVIRRVVAVGGDSVRSGTTLLVNGVAADSAPVPRPVDREREFRLSPRQVYVVAEAAAAGALDSRAFGPVPTDNILGKVWF